MNEKISFATKFYIVYMFCPGWIILKVQMLNLIAVLPSVHLFVGI